MDGMKTRLLFSVLIIGFGVSTALAATPTSTQQAVNRVADRLVFKQTAQGHWPAQGGLPAGQFTGTMVAGLSDAYWMTCKPAYKTAAEKGGQWILNNSSSCNFFYDAAYALVGLSQMACDPEDNQWRTALTDFFGCVRQQPYDPASELAGTAWYIYEIAIAMDPTFAVFEVAHYTVAAYYVNDPDKEIWRNRLIDLLETVANDSAHPVFALGAATWALSQTGPMDDDTPVISVGDTQWGGFPGGTAKKLADLPPLLKSYRIPSYPFAGGHYYWLFVPQDQGDGGWTETSIYGIMGLAAAMKADPAFNYRTDIDIVWSTFLNAVDVNGDVWYDAYLSPGAPNNDTFYFIAGEFLQALSAARLPGDINLDDDVNLTDLAALAINWLSLSGCTDCSIADLTRDRKVNLADFAKLAEGWLLDR